jgi:hypothetical protein
MATHLMLGEDPTGNLKTIKVDSLGNVLSGLSTTVQNEIRKNIDSRIRVTACFAGYAINASGSTVASMTTLANDVGYNSPSDIKFTLNGALKFILVPPSTNPTSGDLDDLTDFFNSKQFGSTIIINYETLGSSAQINAGNFDTGILVLVNHIMAYKQANPLWNAEVIIKTGHETNLTASYLWAAVNSVNLAAAGGVLQTSINNWATAYRRVSNLIRVNSTVDQYGFKINNPTVDGDGVPVYSDTVRPFIRIAHEMAVANNTLFTAESLLKFNPGAKYYDILSFNPYNRSFTSSGDGEWRSFETFTRYAFKSVAPVMAPGKDLMIGEMATMGSGRVTDAVSAGLGSSFTIVSGGTGFPANQNNVPVPDAAIVTDASTKPTIRYTTNGSGVITAFSANNPGEEATYVTINNFSGGSGLNVSVRVRNANESKARWWAEALDYIKNETDVKYVNGFLENKGTVSNTDWTDLRDWAWNSLLTRRIVGIALGKLNKRTEKSKSLIVQNPNLCPDPFTSSVANFAVSGSNAGTLTRVTASTHLIPYTNLVTGVLSLTHNGTAGTPESNQITFDITPTSAISTNQQCTAVIMAKFNSTTPLNPNTSRATIRFGMYPDTTTASFGKRLPAHEVNEYYPSLEEPYVFSVATGNPASTKWTAAIQVGQNNLAGTFYFTCIGFFIGNEYYPLAQSSSDSSASPIGIFSQTSTTTVGNTTTETSILGTGAGNKTLPASFWEVGKSIKINMQGVYGSQAVPGTLTFRVKLGAVTLAPVATATITPPVSQTNSHWNFDDVLLTCRAIGASGSITMGGAVKFVDRATGAVKYVDLQQSGSTTIDTTASNLIDVTVQWSAANVADTITSRNAIISRTY